MGDGGMLALTWNNHSTTFFKTLSTVRIKERYTDVTLSCEGKFYQLHKLVLSTCSDYFEKIFEQTPCKHPVIVLRDVSCDELEALLNYMYLGSVSVAQNDLSRLIKVAELFQIKGLAVPDEPPKISDNNSYSNKRSDNRDRNGSYKSAVSESSRTRTSVSDSSDIPLPKRARTNESYSGSESISHSAASVSQKELSRLDNRSLSQGDSTTPSGGSDVVAATGLQGSTFDFHIKEEVIHDVRDSDSEAPSPAGAFDALNDPDSSGAFDPSHDESPQMPPFVPKSEPEDLSSEDPSGMEPESYNEDVLGMPGPSDAQGWYSEGDASGGLPKGSMGDESQDMLPLLASQQQQSQQSMMSSLNPSQEFSIDGRTAKVYQCMACPYSTTYKTNFKTHLLVHTREKPHPCHFCGRSFSQKSTLDRHVQRHTGEKPFQCTQCNYRTARKSSLRGHVLRKHSELGIASDLLL